MAKQDIRLHRLLTPLSALVADYNNQNLAASEKIKRTEEKREITYDIHEKTHWERLRKLLSSDINLDKTTGRYLLTESAKNGSFRSDVTLIIETLLQLLNDDKRRELIRNFAIEVGGEKFSESCYAIKTYLTSKELYVLLKEHDAIMPTHDEVSIHRLIEKYYAEPKSELDVRLKKFYDNP